MPGDPGSVGRAPLGAQFATQNFVPTGPAPCGVVSNADDVYWANGGSPGTIGSSHGVFDVRQSFITATSDPCGVAQAEGLIYWTNRGDNTIGVANQDGSNQVQDLIADTGASSAPCGVAVDGGHIYWTNRGTETIGRADLDGSDQQDDFISGAGVQDPCGIAVTPTAAADPSAFSFADTGAGGQSELASFYVANTSSAVLSFSGATLDGPDAGDFEITGNGCVANAAPPGLGCIVNARFVPTSSGERSAVLRVTSSASNSPTEFAAIGYGHPAPSPDRAAARARHALRRPPRAFAHPDDLARPALGQFKGTLTSEAPACAADQEVALLRRRRGKIREVGSDLANDFGRWRVKQRDARGRFYAVARPSGLADGALCLPATSPTIRVRN